MLRIGFHLICHHREYNYLNARQYETMDKEYSLEYASFVYNKFLARQLKKIIKSKLFIYLYYNHKFFKNICETLNSYAKTHLNFRMVVTYYLPEFYKKCFGSKIFKICFYISLTSFILVRFPGLGYYTLFIISMFYVFIYLAKTSFHFYHLNKMFFYPDDHSLFNRFIDKDLLIKSQIFIIIGFILRVNWLLGVLQNIFMFNIY